MISFLCRFSPTDSLDLSIITCFFSKEIELFLEDKLRYASTRQWASKMSLYVGRRWLVRFRQRVGLDVLHWRCPATLLTAATTGPVKSWLRNVFIELLSMFRKNNLTNLFIKKKNIKKICIWNNYADIKITLFHPLKPMDVYSHISLYLDCYLCVI